MQKIILYGDDILAGFEHGKVTAQMTQRLQKAFPQTTVINRALPGHRTTDALTHVQRDVSALDPAVVVLFFGANDILPVNEIKPGIFTNNLAHLFAALSPAQIILVSPPYIDYHKQPARSWPRQLQFELASEHMARKYQLPYINLLKAMQAQQHPQQYLQEDGLTFNARGYDFLTHLLVPLIKNCLQRTPSASALKKAPN